MEVLRADRLPFDPRPALSHLFVECFPAGVISISKDKDLLKAVFCHMFHLEQFFVALVNGRIVAMLACTKDGSPAIHLEKEPFTRNLGFLWGNLSFYRLKNRMVRSEDSGLIINKNTGHIEFVATDPEYRRKGAARELIRHTLASGSFFTYALRVADTNQGALRLYQNMGFREVKREHAAKPKRTGVNYIIYMKASKPPHSAPDQAQGR